MASPLEDLSVVMPVYNEAGSIERVLRDLHAKVLSRVPNVEVLNFGNPWYGYHQTYILWEEIGRRFAATRSLPRPISSADGRALLMRASAD